MIKYPMVEKVMSDTAHSVIDLQYISASPLARELARCTNLTELRDALRDLIQEDTANALGYIRKYDNKQDRLETDVTPLKQELDQIEKILGML
jgi:hypothetical protein